MPTYKEKQQELKDRDLANYGFLGYPLLQTADIIIYRAKYVPVGVDQVPHLEISREIARKFNNLYREVFPEPDALLTEFPKVPGVDGTEDVKELQQRDLSFRHSKGSREQDKDNDHRPRKDQTYRCREP